MTFHGVIESAFRAPTCPPQRDVRIIFLAVGGEFSVAEPGNEDIIDGGSIDAVDLLKAVVHDHVALAR